MTASTSPSQQHGSNLQFTIGIDGGGTKTIGRICDHLSGDTYELKSGPSSLSNDYEGAKEVIAHLLSDLLAHFDAQAKHTAVVIGVAGGGVEKQAKQLHKDLPFVFAHLDVYNDAKTSLVGANGGKPIAMVALGTGSVGAKLNDQGVESYTGGWGFPIGDGGSGAKLGFRAVQTLLEEIDWHGGATSVLGKKIQSAITESDRAESAELNNQQIANWLAKGIAKDFAELTKYVLESTDVCPLAAALLDEHVAECEKLILQTRADTELDVVLMGGLAPITLAKLSPKVSSFCKLAQGSSLDGACLLASDLREQLSEVQQQEDSKEQQSRVQDREKLLAQLSGMVSETPNPESADLDLSSTREVLAVINSADKQVPEAITPCLDDIEQAVKLVVQSFEQEGRLIYVGAGTSGRLGILDAVECPPTFSVEHGKVIGLIAGGDKAIYKSVEGAEDSIELGARDLVDINLTDKDTVVGIAASGRTPYVLGALDYAKSVGANTVTLSCNPDSVLATYGHVNICPVVGPEVLTGSTRMKSGTAQKLVLNMLTTASMIKTGKSFGNLMVDVKASNKKLYVRAIRIVMQATQCSAESAELALEKSQYNAKVAILHMLTGVDIAAAKSALLTHKGFLRKAINALEQAN